MKKKKPKKVKPDVQTLDTPPPNPNPLPPGEKPKS